MKNRLCMLFFAIAIAALGIGIYQLADHRQAAAGLSVFFTVVFILGALMCKQSTGTRK